MVSEEITRLLEKIASGELGRHVLHEWLAQHSLRFFQSPDEIDRMIVADLDAALAENARAADPDIEIRIFAKQLLASLTKPSPIRSVVVETSEQFTFNETGTSNIGGDPRVVVVSDLVHAW